MSRVAITPTTPRSELPYFLTIKQYAAYTQQSTWTVRKAVDEGHIPSVKLGRKITFIPKEYLTQAAESALAEVTA